MLTLSAGNPGLHMYFFTVRGVGGMWALSKRKGGHRMSFKEMMWIIDGVIFAVLVIGALGYIGFVRWKNRRDR